MANEWVIVDRLEDPLDYTVAEPTLIEKGSLMKLTDSGTAIISSGGDTADPIAGVLAAEKLAGDGRTQHGCYKRGRFIAVCSGAVTIGTGLVSASDTNYPNTVAVADTLTDSGAQIIATAEAAGSDTEAIQVFLDVGGGS